MRGENSSDTSSIRRPETKSERNARAEAASYEEKGKQAVAEENRDGARFHYEVALRIYIGIPDEQGKERCRDALGRL